MYTGMRCMLVPFKVSIALIEIITISRQNSTMIRIASAYDMDKISDTSFWFPISPKKHSQSHNLCFGSHLDNKGVTIHSMTPYPSYMLVSLRSKLSEFSLIGSFLGCLRQRQKVVRHIPRVYISWRPPHPAESSTTSCRLFQGAQNHWMGIISHTSTCPAIHMHLICQFACIQSTFHSVKGHNRRIQVPKRRRLTPSWDVVDDRHPHQLVHGDILIYIILCLEKIFIVTPGAPFINMD